MTAIGKYGSGSINQQSKARKNRKRAEKNGNSNYKDNWQSNIRKEYLSYENLEKLKEDYDALILANAEKTDDTLIEHITKELETLRDDLVASEADFFNVLGINPSEGAARLNQIKKKLDIWNQFMPAMLTDNNLFTSIAETMLVTLGSSNGTVENTIETIVNDYMASEAKDKIDLTQYDQLSNILNVLLDPKEKKFGTTKVSSLNKIKISWDKNKLKIESKDINDELSNGLKHKLYKGFADRGLTIKQTNETNNIFENISPIFEKYIKQKDIQSIFLDELQMEINKTDKSKLVYNLNTNRNVIIGFVGEIYWTSFVKYIFENKDFSAVGNVKNDGKSISIDMIMKGTNTGFQIKNWQNIDEDHITEKSMLLGNFIEDKAKMKESAPDQARLIEMRFGASAYNKPTDMEELQNDKYSNYVNYYNNTLAYQETELKSLLNIFKMFLHHIIGLDNVEATIDEKQGVYSNTFWAIGTKLIPSSVIVNNMIRTIRKDKGKHIDFAITSLYEKNNKSVWPSKTNFDDKAMANRWGINYNYTFKLSALTKSAIRANELSALINQ